MAYFPDGLDELRSVVSSREIASLIERTARWVAPETFQLLPVWFPEHSRQGSLYKGNWSEPQMNKNKITGQSVRKAESNVYASKALTLALGLSSKSRTNWSCCHIWGVDDPKLSNEVARDGRFFLCIGNMVLLPTPLKAFTDTMPEIKAMLRICAHNLYGWECDHINLLASNKERKNWNDWNSYPDSWPKTPHEKKPLGVLELTPSIRASVQKRKAQIRHDLEHAGKHYPHDDVRKALDHWKIVLN